jgi:protein-tyrosine phosphatase
VIDLHCHVLPGIDDGPAAIEGSVVIARAAAASGARTIVATPHVSLRYPNDADTIARLVGELSERLAREEVPLEVRSGAEIAIATLVNIDPGQLPRLGLGGGPWLLVEPPFAPYGIGVEAILLDLLRRGHRLVLAHPERCPAFHTDPQMLGSLVRAGVLTSVTAGSLVGRFGEKVRRFALAMAREGKIHNVASDAHDHLRRPPGIASELAQAGLGPLMVWLTQAVPEAILADEQIPPRPAGAVPNFEEARRHWWRRRGSLRRAL